VVELCSRTEQRVQNIDVVIVHYPSTKDVLECLETLEGADARVASITVVNNDSPEQIGPEMFAGRDVNVLNRDTNDGFGTAANSGSTQGDASLILLINPDVRLDPESFSSLVSLVGSDGIGAAAPRLVLPNGEPQSGPAGYSPGFLSVASHAFQVPDWFPGGWFERPIFLRRSQAAETNGGGPIVREVDWVSGACMLVRRQAFEQVGGFDHRFFMYGEDMDLCFRLKREGWRVVYCPTEYAEHHHLSSADSVDHRAAPITWLEGLDRLYSIHCPKRRRLLNMVSACGFALRSVAYSLRIAKPRSQGDGAGRRMAQCARHATRLAIRS
jgi:N-acetylglucosaminyl-diphospho-decaprenol L-rhamnosyltransferase